MRSVERRGNLPNELMNNPDVSSPSEWSEVARAVAEANQQAALMRVGDLNTATARILSAIERAVAWSKNPCSKIFDHKWLDPKCVENGCQSLLIHQGGETLTPQNLTTRGDSGHTLWDWSVINEGLSNIWAGNECLGATTTLEAKAIVEAHNASLASASREAAEVTVRALSAALNLPPTAKAKEILASLASLQRDKTRLDWLEKNERCAMCWNVGATPDNGWTIPLNDGAGSCDGPQGFTLRDAIDAAMSVSPSGGEQREDSALRATVRPQGQQPEDSTN